MSDHVFDKVPPGFVRQPGAPGVLTPRDPHRGKAIKDVRKENAALRNALADVVARLEALEAPKKGKK